MKLIYSILCLLLPVLVFAQTGTVKGVVTTADGKPAEYVNVAVKGTVFGATTDRLGNFIIFDVPPGKQVLVASSIGFEPVEELIEVTADKPTLVNFSLAESAVELGEVIVTGQQRRTSTVTKTMTPLQDIPIAVQIVGKELMQQQLVMDTREALRNVSGVTVTGTYNGGYAFYNSRGFNMNNWSNFRRNGMMIWNMGHHHNDNIEQVEVLKGPASILYGDVAPGGIVNFATKRPLNYDYRRFELRVGQYGLFRPTFDISGPVNEKGNLLYRINATYERSNSFRDEVQNEAVMLAPALTWRINPRLTWDIEGTYKFDQRVGDPGIISPDGSFEAVKQLPVSRFLGEPGATYSFNDKSLFSTFNYSLTDNWKIRNQTYYSDTYRDARQIYFVGTPDEAGNASRRQFYFNQFFRGWGNSLDLIGEIKTGPIKHQALIGFDYMINSSDFTRTVAQRLDTTINIFTPQFGLPTLLADPMNWSGTGFFYERAGIYAQDQISAYGGKLQLLVGLRYNLTRNGTRYWNEELRPEDHDVPMDNPVSPRLGIVYKPIEAVSLYGSYSQSYEMNGQDWIDQSISIAPTDATQVEFGVKGSFFKQRLGVTLSAFQIDKRNIYWWIDAPTEPTIDYISWDSEGLWATYQGGHHRSEGIELDVNGRLFDVLTIFVTEFSSAPGRHRPFDPVIPVS